MALLLRDNNPGTRPPQFHISPNSQGSVVLITGIVLFLVTLLSTVARLAEIPAKKRRATLSDGVALVANALDLGQVICISLSVKHGLGHHLSDPSAIHLRPYYVTSYVAEVLAVATQAGAKLSLISLGYLLNPHWSILHQRIILAIVAVWTVFGILGPSLQCGGAHPFTYTIPRCHTSALGIQMTIVLVNLLTDAYLGLFMLPAIWNLHMDSNVKLMLVAFFTPRVLVCVPQLVTLIYLPGALMTKDQTWSETRLAILFQTTIALSLITANLPAMKRLLYSLQTGQSGTRLTERQEAQLELHGSRGFTRHTTGPSTITPPTSFASRFFRRSISKHDSTLGSEDKEKELVLHREGAGATPTSTMDTISEFGGPANEGGIWRGVDVHVEVHVEVHDAEEV